MGIPLPGYRIGRGENLFDLEERWNAAYGVAAQGVVLIRSDGCIAWRSPGMVQSPEEVLEKVLAHLLGRRPVSGCVRPRASARSEARGCSCTCSLRGAGRCCDRPRGARPQVVAMRKEQDHAAERHVSNGKERRR